MNDDGLLFLASVRTVDGDWYHRETPNRFELLAWIDAHSDAELRTLTMQASGPAVASMLAAVRMGAAHLAKGRLI